MDGLVLLDKPAGPTSHDVVDALRRRLRLDRAGHAGTLDPAATGLLLLLVNRATRIAEYLEGFDKTYHVTVRLGVRTPTDDLASPPVSTRPVPDLTPESIEEALARFRGPIRQRPPDYAAIKVQGRRLYDLARAGRPADAPPRDVTIRLLAARAWRPPDLDLAITCSAGTYVRALARDLGEALGCGGAAASIRRAAAGPFRVEEAVQPDAIHQASLPERLLPLDRALDHLPRVLLRPEALEKLRHGQVLGPEDLAEAAPPGLQDDSPCRLIAGDALAAVGLVAPASADSPGGPLFRPKKVFL